MVNNPDIIGQATRNRNRNYIGVNGREVYWRNKRQHGVSKDREGWACCYCGRFEFDCICDKEKNENRIEGNT